MTGNQPGNPAYAYRYVCRRRDLPGGWRGDDTVYRAAESEPGFHPQSVALRQVSDTEFELLEGLTYTAVGGSRIVVEVGERTDFASIPRPLAWLFPRYSNWTVAAIAHDHLYRVTVAQRGMRYRFADKLMLEMLRLLGVPFATRWVIFSALRLAGLVRQPVDVFKDPVVFVWGLVMLPFVALPVVTIAVSLLALWLFEVLAYGPLRLFSRRKQVNQPVMSARPRQSEGRR